MGGKDRLMVGKDKAMQVLFTFLFVVQTIATAAGVDPVEFFLSKEKPGNKPQVPLPDNFKYSAGINHKTDCCSLVLYVTVKDWSPHTDPDDYDDSGEVPPKVKEPQIGPGVVDFTLSHPQIRDGDEIFSMNYVKNEEGPQRFIINFNNCLSIKDKIFGIYASTNIVDTKDIRIVIRNGKDEGVNCEITTATINKTTPINTDNQGRTQTTESGIPWYVVIIAIIGYVGWGITGIKYFKLKKKYFKLRKDDANSGQPEKAVAPGAAPTDAGEYSALNIEEPGDTKGGPRGGSRNTTLKKRK